MPTVSQFKEVSYKNILYNCYEETKLATENVFIHNSCFKVEHFKMFIGTDLLLNPQVDISGTADFV